MSETKFEQREIVAIWDDDTQAQFLKLIEDFTVEHGNAPVFINPRNDSHKYHLDVLCNVARTFLTDAMLLDGNVENFDGFKVLEIGSYLGDSTIIFAKHFGHVMAVDPYGLTNKFSPVDDLVEEVKSKDDEVDMQVKLAPTSEILHFYMENHVVANHENIELRRMTSDDFFYNNTVGPKSSQYPLHRFDLIYVDGDHRYSQQIRDYTNALSCLNPQGIVAGHDFSWESTQRVLKELGFDKKPILHFGDDSFMILPKYMH